MRPSTAKLIAEALANERPEAKARALALKIKARKKGDDLPCTPEELRALHLAMDIGLRRAARRRARAAGRDLGPRP